MSACSGVTRPRGRNLAVARLIAGVVLGVGVVLALPGCSTTFKPDEARGTQVIKINLGATEEGRAPFSPNPATVVANTEIIWTNMDTTEHRISSMSGFFEAPKPIKQGESFSYIFEQPRNYRYYCTIPGHSEQGVINVTP